MVVRHGEAVRTSGDISGRPRLPWRRLAHGQTHDIWEWPMANGPERWWQRHLSVFVAVAGLAAVLAVGIVLGVGNGTPGPVHHTHVTNRTRHRQYVRVLSALSTTTAASSF